MKAKDKANFCQNKILLKKLSQLQCSKGIKQYVKTIYTVIT